MSSDSSHFLIDLIQSHTHSYKQQEAKHFLGPSQVSGHRRDPQLGPAIPESCHAELRDKRRKILKSGSGVVSDQQTLLSHVLGEGDILFIDQSLGISSGSKALTLVVSALLQVSLPGGILDTLSNGSFQSIDSGLRSTLEPRVSVWKSLLSMLSVRKK